MIINSIFNNNQTWVQNKLAQDKDYFKNLSKFQSPEILYIGCSDSRVSAEELMGVNPGDVFVHRNIANIVTNGDLSVMCTINYAVMQLKVKHIIVCGHYNCGGIKAAMEQADYGILNPWLRNIRDVYRLHKEELNKIPSQLEKDRRLTELHVQEQCINLIKTADVQKAYFERKIGVHGWVFDMSTGKLKDLNINFEKILANIMEIYKII